jgi:hypothetical protein
MAVMRPNSYLRCRLSALSKHKPTTKQHTRLKGDNSLIIHGLILSRSRSR